MAFRKFHESPRNKISRAKDCLCKFFTFTLPTLKHNPNLEIHKNPLLYRRFDFRRSKARNQSNV